MPRFAPRRGDALLFLQVQPFDHEVRLPLMWHGGCKVRRGEKQMLTFFKEMPPAPAPWRAALAQALAVAWGGHWAE